MKYPSLVMSALSLRAFAGNTLVTSLPDPHSHDLFADGGDAIADAVKGLLVVLLKFLEFLLGPRHLFLVLLDERGLVVFARLRNFLHELLLFFHHLVDVFPKLRFKTE